MTGVDAQRQPGGAGTLAGRAVARVGFGAMQLAESAGRPRVDRATALTVLRRAVELGVNHFDTATFYGDGLANELIASALRPYPADLTLATKVGAEHDARAGLIPAQRPEQLRASVEANLAGLGVEQLAVVNLRRLDTAPGLIAEGDQRVDLDSQLAELTALRAEGKIAGIGLSGVSADQVRRALPAGIVCVQNMYNVLDRSGEPLLRLCREHGLAWVPFFPLGSAFPGSAKVADDPAVTAAAATLGVTPAQVGLAWLLQHAPHILIIPGTANLAHLADNVAAGQIDLGPEITAALDGRS